MAQLFIDAYGHEVTPTGPNYAAGLTAAATGTTVAGTFTPIAAGAGTGATAALISGITPTDRRGRYTLTSAGTPAAGIISHVTFTQPYSALPAAILVSVTNTTDTLVVAGIGVANVTVAGFDIVGPALVTGKAHQVSYVVIP